MKIKPSFCSTVGEMQIFPENRLNMKDNNYDENLLLKAFAENLITDNIQNMNTKWQTVTVQTLIRPICLKMKENKGCHSYLPSSDIPFQYCFGKEKCPPSICFGKSMSFLSSEKGG